MAVGANRRRNKWPQTMKTSPQKGVEVLLLGSGAVERMALVKSMCNWGSPCCAQHSAQRASLFFIAMSLQICLSELATGHG